METGPRFKVSSERLEERGIKPALIKGIHQLNPQNLSSTTTAAKGKKKKKKKKKKK